MAGGLGKLDPPPARCRTRMTARGARARRACPCSLISRSAVTWQSRNLAGTSSISSGSTRPGRRRSCLRLRSRNRWPSSPSWCRPGRCWSASARYAERRHRLHSGVAGRRAGGCARRLAVVLARSGLQAADRGDVAVLGTSHPARSRRSLHQEMGRARDVIGRFSGPLRASVPIAAGMSGCRCGRFRWRISPPHWSGWRCCWCSVTSPASSGGGCGRWWEALDVRPAPAQVFSDLAVRNAARSELGDGFHHFLFGRRLIASR